ncbi:valyl-tRNA synthetase [Trichormus variabilis ATCC 29413]|uniref:Valine--tRNA ligase n=2 Tax=Anabaena variabilis TaxID=264691 RepID=Q3M8U4_TRIV2|nr:MULTISPECIES: valine--tRNA ligase [Nostocaceae]ABA22592.1 valyl-tRNA synthetase [Trichormus variabilis ATCC 29413]MBC1216419.1 valine--tRNA ligase [Trichormus variabilis ARAD]MBC1257548.1 valine--tRNA ligase [Trichormus variabilis V5]MBC1265457.1 valine--tRNA ligase [Trichormus variabilis FSR]MBC1304677.1 valine--tRNA ligase [Trichormus variabilis N2B]
MTATITNLPSLYDPFTTEAKWQKFWEENQIYKADPNKDGEPYCVVIPPPNVTGSLHMGHAFESALIDTLVRYHRMQGRNTLWLPGTDHASIAVHTILEKQLKAEGKTRQELGRDKFLERSWQWKAESGGTIVNQLRRLGVSVDWSRERFTLDEGLSKAVAEAFVSLYEEGLIYRGEYLVNWCPATQSAVSDVEVESKEVEGNLWHFRYPLTDGSGYVEVATTRPETMLGDTAVAVNPNDDRYKHLIGKTLTLPITQREIPIISDELVDPAFGTGCVKVTPAHDPNDFEMGKRHNLPFINILNKDGTLNANGGEFAGQDRFVARKNVVSRLETDGFLVKIEDYKHTVPYSDRGKVPVEPLLSTQWFVQIRPLADKALAFLDEKNSPEFVPQRWTKVYRDWLVNLRDWCISRQLWWGHQIPAWYAVSETNGQITDNTPFVVAKSTNEAWEKAKAQFGENVQLEQDPDVLDTWFSSGLWPFSTLGWPEQTPDLAKYYPTTTLVTGFDIIFFWVARMTMMAGHFTGQMPFQTVYIHGLVRDENNKKMSKSANNGIDPLLLIDKYGTDALRYTLVREVAGAGQDIRLEYDRKKDESPSVEASRNFANKLWNAARFVMMNLDGQTPGQLGQPNATELSDRWIISRYHQVIKQTTNYIDNYGLGEAAKGIYEFIWGDFCDWYIELVKSRLQKDADPLSRKAAQQTLAYVLEGILKLLHPFMPHITEEIWQTLTQQPENSSQTLALQAYPQADANWINPALETQFDLLIGTIRTIRNLRAEAEVKPGARIIANLQTDSESERQILIAGQSYIKDLAKVETLTIAAGQQPSTVTKKKPQRGLKTIGLVIAGLVFLRVALAVADTVDNVPFLGNFFEIVGLGYSAWFVARNLLSTPARQRFLAKFFASPTEKNLSETVPQAPQAAEKSIAGVVGTVQVVIPLAGVVDIETLRAKLERSISKAEAEAQSLKGRLSNPKFVDKAPADVVQAARDALAEAEKQVEILRLRLQTLV